MNKDVTFCWTRPCCSTWTVAVCYIADFHFMERKSRGRSRAGFLSIQSKVLVLFKTCNCEATLFGVTSGSKSIFKILSETLFEIKTPINSHCKRENWLKRGLLRLFGTNNKSVALSFTTHHLLVEGFRECFQCSQPRVSEVEKSHPLDTDTSLTLKSQQQVKHVAVRRVYFG